MFIQYYLIHPLFNNYNIIGMVWYGIEWFDYVTASSIDRPPFHVQGRGLKLE